MYLTYGIIMKNLKRGGPLSDSKERKRKTEMSLYLQVLQQLLAL